MPAGVAGAATAVSDIARRKKLMEAGHVPWEDTPGLDRGRAIMTDRPLKRAVLKLRGVTDPDSVSVYDDYVPRKKPEKKRTPLEKAILRREE